MMRVHITVPTLLIVASLFILLPVGNASAQMIISSTTPSFPGIVQGVGDSVVEDSDGHIWLSGRIYKSTSFATQDVLGWLGKFDGNLVLLASATVQGSAPAYNVFGTPTIDASGNVFIPAGINIFGYKISFCCTIYTVITACLTIE